MYTLLKNKLDGMKETITDFTRELIATPSVTFDEAAVAEKVRQRLTMLGYDKVFQDNFRNVVGILYGREHAPTVLLTSHMDTVAAGTTRPWRENPLSARLEAGKIHGLGAADCKGGLAAQACAGALLKRSLLPLCGNLVFAATVAQGNGLSIGIRELMNQTLPELGFHVDYAIMGEPTSLGLYYGHDGWAKIELKVEGRNAFHVEDAARAIADDFVRVVEYKEAYNVVDGPEFQDTRDSRLATITLNRRMLMSESVEDIIKRIEHEAAMAVHAPGIAIEVNVRRQNRKLYTGQSKVVSQASKGWSIDPYSPLVVKARQALAAAGRKAHPGRWKLGRFGMGTAGNVLVEELNIPTIGYGPGREELAHACNEFVEVESLNEAVYGTAAMVHGLVGIPVYGWTSDEI